MIKSHQINFFICIYTCLKVKVKIIFSIMLCLNFLGTQYIQARKTQKNTIVFFSRFNSKYQKNWSKLSTAKYTLDSVSNDTCLTINDSGMIQTPINLIPYKGMKLLFQCRIKAENVTRPLKSYLGIKYMLEYHSSTGDHYQNPENIYGTFNWKTLSFTFVVPSDVQQSNIFLGIQGSIGTVWFDSVSVVVNALPVSSINRYKQKHNIEKTQYRGTMISNNFQEIDAKTLSNEWNANIIRYQLNAPNLAILKDITLYDEWINTKLKDLDNTLVMCKKYGIKIVIDLHTPPGGKDKSSFSEVFYNKDYNTYFINLWKIIAERYKGNTNIWGYDLINEPSEKASTFEYKMNLCNTQIEAAKNIRTVDKETPIIFEVNLNDSPSEFKYLTPIALSNIIYEVHMYDPCAYTMQGVSKKLSNSVSYPGLINGVMYNKKKIKDILQPVRDFQLTYNVPIYVGEFSAVRWAPGAAKYLDDCISIFEEYGWNWTYHAFREWNGWDVEYENGTSKTEKAKRATQDSDRKKVLLKWFAKNKR